MLVIYFNISFRQSHLFDVAVTPKLIKIKHPKKQRILEERERESARERAREREMFKVL